MATEFVHLVLCQCPTTLGSVTVVGTTLATETYNRCLTVTSVTVASTLTTIGNYFYLKIVDFFFHIFSYIY